MFSNILGGAAGFPVADLGDEVSQSLRFRGSEELKRSSVRSASNASATISVWVKLGNVNTSMRRILTIESSGGSWGLGIVYNSNKIWVYDSTTTDGNASQSDGVLRDPSAWYHIVYNRSAGGTDQELYINGVLQNASASFTTSVDLFSIRHEIGGRDGDPTASWEGYLADFHFVDGSKLDPTSFGKTNGDGVWVPINYSGGHGSMGYYLPFDSSADGGIGDDASTNADDFTATGFDTAAISSSNPFNDVDYNDTPTSNYATLNPSIAYSSFTNSNGNLTSSVSTVNGTVEATIGVTSGQWYWEVLCQSSLVYAAVGVSEGYVSSWTSGNAFVYTGNGHTTGFTGGDGNSSGSSQTYGDTYSDGDIIGVALDMDGGTLTFFKNGVSQGTATSSGITGKTLYPVVGQSNSSAMQSSINLGQMPFIYTPPTGYSALQTNNLPEPTIKNGKEHFGVLTWSGTGGGSGATRSLTGLEFSPNLVWGKVRSSSGVGHILMDSVRGVGTGKYLQSNTSNAEGTSGPNESLYGHLSSLDSNGFTVTNGTSTFDNWNKSGDTYVAWCWKAGGTAVSNTDGTITSSVSANTDAGFSIVSYTGTNANATVGHGLSSPPEMIIIKNRTDSANWIVYHEYVDSTAPEDYYLMLHVSDARTGDPDGFVFNGTAPTSSVFNVGAFNNTNGSGDNLIAYCWHSVEGYSKMGSYTGNGNSDGPFVYLGFKPALLAIKCTTQSEDWFVHDSARYPNNPSQTIMRWNTNGAESGTGNDIDFLSNGFKIRNTVADVNASGQTFVYMAWAENPFGGENAAPATAR